jgi:hypothetical protein
VSSGPRAPSGLAAAGRRLWREMVSTYEFSPGELETLRQACRTADVLARIDVELGEADVTVIGSRGQPRSHPLLESSAEQRALLDQLLRSLALPMPDETEGTRRAPQQVAAAQARWRAQKARRGVG